jgi:hypothetical protein
LLFGAPGLEDCLGLLQGTPPLGREIPASPIDKELNHSDG